MSHYGCHLCHRCSTAEHKCSSTNQTSAAPPDRCAPLGMPENMQKDVAAPGRAHLQ